MQIVYCEGCTKRIPPAELERNAAVFIAENQALCAACSAARPAVQVPDPAEPAPAQQQTGAHTRPPTARLEPRPTTARRTVTSIKKGAGSSGGVPQVKDKASPARGRPPVAAIAGGGAAAVCVILYLLFGGAGTATQTATAEPKVNEATKPEPLTKSEAAMPADPIEAPRRKEIDARPLPPDPSQPGDNPPAVRSAVDKPVSADRAAAETKETKPQQQPHRDASDTLKDGPDSTLPVQRKEPAAPEMPPTPPTDPLAVKPAPAAPLNDDTPDAPLNRDGIGARKTASAAKAPNAGGGAAAAKPPAPPAAANPAKPAASKPAFVRGKQCELFPTGAASHTDDIVDPRSNRPAKIDRFDGWIFNSQQLTGMSVKDGVLSLNHQALMQLDRFPCLEYKLQFEVQLGNNSALALQTGAAIAVSNLLIITETHAMPGAWDTAKTENNIKGEENLAKPHGGAKDGWIPVTVSVHADAIDCIFGAKAPVRFALPKTATLAQLGFLTLGIKGNTNPSVKIRRASLYAP